MLKRYGLVLLAVLTVAAAGAQTGKIRISATANVFVAPDVAQVVFSVTSEDPDKTKAEETAAAEVKAILDEITALKLPGLKTRTPPSQTKKQEAWPPGSGGSRSSYGGSRGIGETPRKAGYVVGTVVEVWFEGDAETLEAGVNKVVSIAETHGATNIAP
ncbi:MAG: SIMPL domain-containing protein, partial [Armatimonadetes bacterium]|nr:SIMPL domain-containing protein [Armatimonadota bacterium]